MCVCVRVRVSGAEGSGFTFVLFGGTEKVSAIWGLGFRVVESGASESRVW